MNQIKVKWGYFLNVYYNKNIYEYLKIIYGKRYHDIFLSFIKDLC